MTWTIPDVLLLHFLWPVESTRQMCPGLLNSQQAGARAEQRPWWREVVEGGGIAGRHWEAGRS